MKIVDTSGQNSARGSSKIEMALDWLLFYDKIDRKIFGGDGGALMKYQPFTIINFHRLFAGVSKPSIEFPRADYEV